MTTDDKRCVITGLGMICAIGNSVEQCWDSAMAGKTGIDHTKTVSTEGCYTDYAGEVKCDTLDTKENKHMDRVTKLCIKAADEAMADAGLKNFGGDARTGIVMGSCVGGVVSIESYYTKEKTEGYIKQMPISAIASQVGTHLGVGGTCCNIANACAAGTISIAHAVDLIREGKADVIVAGGADAFASVPFAGFISLHALADEPCKPFNHSSGLSLGEGSGVVIVESYAHAKKRGAKIYCEVLGSGVSSDAHHITAPHPEGEGQMNAIRRAITNSGITEADIGYINAHGTGTAKNDAAEYLSLHTLFDDTNDDLAVSSTKSMTGHCLGAAGAIEAVFSIKALTENKMPPTVGFTDEDKEAVKERAGKLDVIPNLPREKQLTTVMSNSFAFGGNNASIVFSKDKGNVRTEKKPHGVVVTGIGAVTPLGNGAAKYVEAVKSDAKVEGGSVRSSVDTTDYDAVGLKMAFYRKLDRFSQLQAVSGMQALGDASYAITADNAVDIGIVIGTSEGAVGVGCDFETLIAERGNAAGSAFKFPNTVYNAAGGYLSICSGIKGYNVTVTNGAQSGISSIAYATTLLRNGEGKAILACGSDENSDIINELYSGLGLVADGTTLPYSGKGKKVTLSDGSISLLLESEDTAKARGARVYCRVKGSGFAHKGVPFATLTGSGEALDLAVKNALDDAGMTIDDVDAIVGMANGNGTVDDIELQSYARVFGDRSIPVISVKERVGEARAAAAALGAAHAALMLHGDIKKDSCAYLLDKGKAKRKAIDCGKLNNVLVTAFGSGGTYCAVIMSKN
ncbi:MAG: beta-ketoacyl-[acyl-carrier-protein] synthase family protein [Clostridiales bacterium]|nr:beta-ketoacyl-[acyl-carrier-protein] synthase family protein [Clostridiales bacterium]